MRLSSGAWAHRSAGSRRENTMKTMMLVGAAIAAMAMIGVVPASAETTKQNDEVLRLQKVREGNVEVALPTVRKPDGTI